MYTDVYTCIMECDNMEIAYDTKSCIMARWKDGSYLKVHKWDGAVVGRVKDMNGHELTRNTMIWMHVMDVLNECVKSGCGRLTIKSLPINNQCRTIATFDYGVLTVAMDERKNLIPFKDAHESGIKLTEISVSKRTKIETDEDGKGYLCLYTAHSRPDSKPAVKLFWVADF